MNNLFWSIRREIWENRSIYLGPLAVGALVLLGHFLSLARKPATGETHYVVGAIFLMAIQLIVAVIYCLDALYGERRDRSVLFWKSMPVSDQTAVLAKAMVPILVLPIVTWLTTVVIQDIMLATSAVAGSIRPPELTFSSISRLHFGHLVLFHGLWYAPLYAWLLLVSAWATRAPFLWAVLPPLAIGIVERIALNTGLVSRAMQWLFLGGTESLSASSGAMTMEKMMPDTIGLLLGPGLWIRLAISAVLLFGAVQLRRSRGVI